MSERVVKIRDNVPGAIRIDRQTPFGNPYMIGRDGDRAEVIRKYEQWVTKRMNEDKRFAAQVAGLAGKTLACWCAPLPCHGDILTKIADSLAKIGGDDES